MIKKALLTATFLLSLWNIFYIGILIDSLTEEYFFDKFFHWGYPQSGKLYSSPRFFVMVNGLYIIPLIFAQTAVYFLRRNPVKAVIVASFISVLSFLNLYVPEYTRQSYFTTAQRLYGDSRIPEGIWLMYPYNLERFEDQSFLSKIKGWWGRGDWPGGYALWGDYRIWITPAPETDDYGRRGLVIHGGTKDGTPWGINIGDETIDVAINLRQSREPLEIEVNYSETR